MIAIRFALYINLMLLFGLPAFQLYAFRGTERLSSSALSFGTAFLVLAIMAPVLAVAGFMLLCAAMAGTPVWGLDRATVEMVITQTPIGTAWQVRMAALIGSLILATGWRQSRSIAFHASISATSAVALGSLAWAGHGAAGEGVTGTIQLAADIVHLLAAGIWIGALAAFGMMMFRSRDLLSKERLMLAARALDRFSLVGTIAVAAILASGLVNGWMLVGPANINHLLSTLYGQLLVLKLMLFGGMLAFAGTNRFRLTPGLTKAIRIGNTHAAVKALRYSLCAESGAALGVLALVAWLGTLAPPMSAG